MRCTLIAVVVAVVAAIWWHEKAEARALEAQVGQLRASTAEREAAQAELRRLKNALPSDTERSTLLAASASAQRLRQQLAERPVNSALALSATPIGEWSPTSSWRNCGTLAPRDTLETALWAAAGGDTTRFSQLLELPDDVRAKANELITRLPPQSRDQYPTAEALLAAFAIKRIPIGPAQVVWTQQSDADNAALCVFIRDPNVPQPPPAIIPAHVETAEEEPKMTREQAVALAIELANRRKAEKSRPDYVPPTNTPSDHTIAAYLSLHRSADGWRLVVPTNAVDKIAKEINGTARR